MLYFAYFLLPVPVHDLPLGVVVVLVLCHHVRRGDVRVAYLRADDIRAALRLVLDCRRDVIRVLQVQRTLRCTQLAVVLRAQLLDLRRCPQRAVRQRHDICCLLGSLVRGLLTLSSWLLALGS